MDNGGGSSSYYYNNNNNLLTKQPTLLSNDQQYGKLLLVEEANKSTYPSVVENLTTIANNFNDNYWNAFQDKQQQLAQQQQLTTTTTTIINNQQQAVSSAYHPDCQPSLVNNFDCSTSQDLYNNIDFHPEEINFSDIQELWLVKDSWNIFGRVILVAPIVLLGILGNLTIIYSMCNFKPFRTKPTNIFILNMAIADFLTTLVCPNTALFTYIYQFYILGSFICRIEGFVKSEYALS